MNTRTAAASAGVFVAWWAWTMHAPNYPTGWTLIGAGVVVLCAIGAYGGVVSRACAPAAAAAVAAVTSAGWVALHYAMPDPPAVWLDRAVSVNAVVWVVAWLVWTFAPDTDRSRRPRKPSPLRAALAASGIRGLALPEPGDGDPVRVSRPSRVGLGERWIVTLPAGVTVDDLTGRSSRVAGALGRPSEDVTIDAGDHASQALVWVGEPGAGKAPAGNWPGLDGYPETSALDPITVGLDRYGQPITIALHGGSGVLIGSIPGRGKSATMNLLISAILADHRASASFVDFKGGADFSAWQPVADGFYSGAPDDDPEAMLRVIDGFVAGMNERIRRLPEYRASKIDERIASEPGMGPAVLVVDEAHEALGRTSSLPTEQRDRVTAAIKTVIARGRAVNCWVLIASQRVTDDEIPAAITQRVTVRIAYRLGTQPASQAVLGPDAWAQGYRATECPAPGIGLLADDEGVRRLRAFYVPDQEAHRLAGLAAARRGVDPSQEPDTGPPTPALSELDTRVLDALSAGREPAWPRVSAAQRELIELVADRAREQAAGDMDAAFEVGPAEPVEAGAVEVCQAVTRAWPVGQRGRLSVVSVVQLAEACGLCVEDVEAGLREAGAPVEMVRVRVADGSRPWLLGLRLATWDEWVRDGA